MTQGIYDVDRELMSAKQRQEYVEQRLNAIVEYAYKNAPAVKRKFDEVGLSPSQIKTVYDLQNIPITRKDDLVELQRRYPPFGGFIAVPLNAVHSIYVSPGPIFEPNDPDEQTDVTAMALYAAGFRKGDIALVAFSFHLVSAGNRIQEGLHKLGVTVVPGGVGNSDLQLQIMHDLKITGYVGTPSFLMTLIQKAEDKGYDFRRDFNLRCASVSAEPLPPALRQTFQENYGISVRQFYGTADVGIVGYECEKQSGMHIPPDIVVEIVEPGTGRQLGPGETGEIVVTTLSNRIYPLIRFGTGDLSFYTDEPCPCGRTSPRLVRIVGRVGKSVKVRGMFIHPGQVQRVMDNFDEVANFQLVVKRREQRDELLMKVEVKSEKIDRKELANKLRDEFQSVCRLRPDDIEFVTLGSIPPQREIISDERTWD
ncbi:MAG TPA: phenylacetate--CoA ligase family protein [Deltaproteobacteria bacterium]|nr:phenylacetate--CoA ligase family protein [Deltaproteobacteria bacterium]